MRGTADPFAEGTLDLGIKGAVIEGSRVLAGAFVNTVARENGIDRMTSMRYVRKTRIDPDTMCKPNNVTKQIFSEKKNKIALSTCGRPAFNKNDT
jgi:uncharacterized protein YcfJ